jgi:hypothetical protein
MDYFDYLGYAREAGIQPDQLAEIEALTHDEYPGDQMLFELRMLRTCKAIRDGRTTAEDVLAEMREEARLGEFAIVHTTTGGPLHV